MQKSVWRKILDFGTSVLLPEVCAGCGMSGEWICSQCVGRVITVDTRSCCQTCGHPATARVVTCRKCDTWPGLPLQARSRFVFDGPLRKSIIRMKYHDEFARAAWHAGHLDELVREVGWQSTDMIVPVPLHPKKVKARGYNQSAKLAKALAESLGLELSACLVRTRNTSSQTGLGPAERWTNMQGAFSCSADLQGRSVLLVDDVLTTGATIHDCAQALVNAGARQVRVVTLATGI